VPSQRGLRGGRRHHLKCQKEINEASQLGLPGELRNHIYRLVLLESIDVYVDRSNYKQPPLLRTCRKMRKEALQIFYKENRFMVAVRDLHFAALSAH